MKDPKSFITLSLLFQVFFCLSQEQVAVELTEAKIMYRGYPNVIFVPQDSCSSYTIDVIVLNNGTIDNGDNPGEYVVSPGSYRYTKLAVVRRSGDAIVDTLRVVEFHVSNLPAPQLYLGPYESGLVVNSLENFLFAKYGGHIFLTAAFNIISWTFYVGDKSISGDGRNISTTHNLLIEIATPTKVMIIAKVKGLENAEYEIQGEWVVMLGATTNSEPHTSSPCILKE